MLFVFHNNIAAWRQNVAGKTPQPLRSQSTGRTSTERHLRSSMKLPEPEQTRTSRAAPDSDPPIHLRRQVRFADEAGKSRYGGNGGWVRRPRSSVIFNRDIVTASISESAFQTTDRLARGPRGEPRESRVRNPGASARSFNSTAATYGGSGASRSSHYGEHERTSRRSSSSRR